MTTTKKAKYTPGPWTIHEQFDFYGTSEQRMYSVHAIWNSGVLKGAAFCGLARLPAERGDAELEANARLISAAPDLLAACEALLEASLGGDIDAMIDGENLGRAAIAKATGAI